MSILGVGFLLIGLIGFDQFTKYLAVEYLKDQQSIPIIKNVFELTYVENRGAAFGILQNQVLFFVIVTMVILAFILFYYKKLPSDKKYHPIRFVFILIVAGAIGNLIDRIFFGYVVDFLYFKLINFPVFNVADSYVSVGAFLLFILVIFVYKEEDFLKLEKEE